MKVLVLGGSRFIGLAVVRRFARLGWEVTVSDRGTRPDSVYPVATRVIHGDRDDPAAWDALRASEYDCVVDTCAYRPDQTALALQALGDRVGRFLHGSTGAVYEPPDVFPIAETQPLGHWPLWGTYGEMKRRCDELLLETYARHAFPAVIVRPPYGLGPGNYARREAHVWDLVSRGQRVAVPDDGDALIQFVLVDELAEVFVGLATCVAGVDGEAFHCGGDEYWTLKGFVRASSRLVGVGPRFTPVREYVRAPYDLNGFFPFPNENCLLDNRKLKARLGFSFRPLEEGLEEVFAWYSHDRGPITQEFKRNTRIDGEAGVQ